jgi:transposase
MPFVSKRPALQLTEEELEDLEKTARSRTQPQRTVERAKILIGYYEHKSVSQIARELDTNRPKVERAINKAFAYGIYVALEDLPRPGRSRRISSDARTWILSLACAKPINYGYPHELWTQRLLAKHIKINCVDFQNYQSYLQERFRKYLERATLSLIRYPHISPKLIQNLNQRVRLYCIPTNR